MRHLSPERIAALVDEPASDEEREHLTLCALCRADLVAVRRIVAVAAAERERPVTPLVSWHQLSDAMRAEGVLGGASAVVRTSGTPVADVRSIATAPSVARGMVLDARRARRWMGMAAAAALLVTVGVAGGRLTAGARPDPIAAAVVPSVSPSIGSVQPATPVSGSPVSMQFRSPDDARATLRSAEVVYSNALLWLAANDSALSPRLALGSEAAASDYRQRLEVLDAAMETARRAMYEAPDDPVMNRYYLATMGARAVTLRRLTTVLPASQQVLEY